MAKENSTAEIGFEKQIWDAACVLRGNMDASEYKTVVLGLIFLKYISDRTGEASITVTSRGKQLDAWRVTDYTPMYRETSGVGRRKLMTMDEVLRMDVDRALVILRGKKVLEVDKYDYSKHPEAKKMHPSKAASHVPGWQRAKSAKPAPPPPPVVPRPTPPMGTPVEAPVKQPQVAAPARKPQPQVVKTSKNSILKPKTKQEE